jgi:hypothetical protein
MGTETVIALAVLAWGLLSLPLSILLGRAISLRDDPDHRVHGRRRAA